MRLGWLCEFPARRHRFFAQPSAAVGERADGRFYSRTVASLKRIRLAVMNRGETKYCIVLWLMRLLRKDKGPAGAERGPFLGSLGQPGGGASVRISHARPRWHSLILPACRLTWCWLPCTEQRYGNGPLMISPSLHHVAGHAAGGHESCPCPVPQSRARQLAFWG